MSNLELQMCSLTMQNLSFYLNVEEMLGAQEIL